MSTDLARDEAEDPEAAEATGVPRRRKAWRPDADAEVAALLRHLSARCWLVAGRDDELISAARRNEVALRAAFTRLGWVLIVDRDLVRLRKSPPPRPVDWAASGPSAATCSWFFLLVAAAESLPPRVAIGSLVNATRAAAAEAGLPTTNDISERRAIVGALRLLDQRGVLERLDGDLDTFVQNEDAPVLFAIHHTRLMHVIANPGTLDPAADPHAWLVHVQREPDPARRMRRALVDDTCVHAALLDDEEAAWLSQRVRGDDGGPLAQAFGLSLERRAEGAAFVVPDEAFRHGRELGDFPFPAPGTLGHAALLLVDAAGIHGKPDGGPGPGWRGLTQERVMAALAGFAADSTTGKGGWSAEYTEDLPRLAADIGSLLGAINALRLTDPPRPEHAVRGQEPGLGDGPVWWFAPVTGRWAEEGSAASATGQRRGGRRRQTQQTTTLMGDGS